MIYIGRIERVPRFESISPMIGIDRTAGSVGCKYLARTEFVRAYWQVANKDRTALHILDATGEIRRGNEERGVPSLKAVES